MHFKSTLETNMNDHKIPVKSAAPNTIPWPPILYLSSAIVAYTIGRLWGVLWITDLFSTLFSVTGIIIIIIGFALDFYSLSTLRKHFTTVMPTKAASNLVTSGPFSISRNPIYLGNTIITLGLTLYFQSFWYILFGLVAAIITNEIVIKREESHLLEMFGDEWKNYTQKVRRWL